MKLTKWSLIQLLLLFLITASCNKTGQEIPSQDDILAAMATANNYFMEKFPDDGKDLVQPPKGIIWKSNIWTRGTYYTGLMSLYRTTNESRLLDYAVDWGEKHDWSLSTKERWNVSLHDPDHFGGKEVTGTAFFLYGMAWGVNNGLLEGEKFKPAIYHGWNTMVNECLHPNGFLGFVQGTGKEPKDRQPVTYNSMPDFEDYGLGAFLLAGCEISKLQ